MLTVGIAGGSGTGKSTIGAHVVRRYGGTHIDADRIAHAVLQDPPVMRRIFDRFGPDMVDTDGQVNRHRLGARVFTDAGSRAALNEIVHPEVIQRCASAVTEARAGSGRVVVVDAACVAEKISAITLRFPSRRPLSGRKKPSPFRAWRCVKLAKGRGPSRVRLPKLAQLVVAAVRFVFNKAFLPSLVRAANARDKDRS